MAPATLLYDGACAFCTRAADAALRWSGGTSAGRLRLAAIRSPEGDALVGDLSAALRDGSFHLVAGDGGRWSGGAAVAPLLQRLPALAWLAPVAAALPGPVDAAYRLVARNRGRLSRGCGLSSP